MTARNKRIISISLKIAILVLAFIFIYENLNNNKNLHDFSTLVSTLSPFKVKVTVVFLFVLMFVNWLIEAVKWKFLVRKIEMISYWKAVESVFCGLTWAIFTPNRIGEYGGRVFFLHPGKRVLGAVAMGVGSIAQLVITNVLGALAMGWFVGKFVPLDVRLYPAVVVVIIVFCSFFLIFFFNISWLNKALVRISFLKKFSMFFDILSGYKKAELLEVFLFSLLRYAVFTTQYCLLINLLIPELPVFQVAAMVSVFLFVQSALPSLAFFDVGVRSITATYIFSYITGQQIAIITTIASILLINLIIPAILGSLFVLKMKFFGAADN